MSESLEQQIQDIEMDRHNRIQAEKTEAIARHNAAIHNTVGIINKMPWWFLLFVPRKRLVSILYRHEIRQARALQMTLKAHNDSTAADFKCDCIICKPAGGDE